MAPTTPTHRKELFLLARRITGNDADADDAVQNAYLMAIEQTAAGRTIESVPAWLNLVVRRRAFDIVRYTYRMRIHAKLSVPCLAVSEELLLDSPVALARLENAMCDCSHPLKEAFLLWRAGLSHREIAQSLKISISTVATRIHRAKLHVRRWGECNGG